MKKRMMAMLMTAILVIASIPFTAFAEEAPAELLGGEVMEAAAVAAEAVEAKETAEEPAAAEASAETEKVEAEVTEASLDGGTETPTNWGLLKNAMAGAEQATVENVFTVENNDAVRTIKLLADIKAGENDAALALEVESTKEIILDLNGYTLNRGLSEAAPNGSVIKITSGATLTLMDGKGGGKVTGGYTSGNGGGVQVNGSFTMTGGSIQKNQQTKSEAYQGGGVYVNTGGTFTMTGGSITDNVGGYGGGVRVNGTFTMTGGTIANNEAIKGGGVYFNSSAEFKMIGGSITNNISTDNGGGVNFNSGKITVGGNAEITGNFKGTDTSKTENNVYLPSTTTTIAIATEEADVPQDRMKIGVTTGTEPASGNSRQITSNGTADDAKYFVADSASCYVSFNSNHLELASIPADKNKITIGSFENGSVTADKQIARKDEEVTLTVTPEAGYCLNERSFQVIYNDSTIIPEKDKTDDKKYTFKMPEYPVTVTAEFIKATTIIVNDLIKFTLKH